MKAHIFCLAFYWGLTSNAKALTLEYLSSFIFSTAEKFQETQIGGLSGITKNGDRYWAVSDAKGQKGEPRMYSFNINLTDIEFTVKPSKVVFLKNKKGKPFGEKVLDLEGIISFGNSFLTASEGLLDQKPRELPALLEFNSSGQLTGEIPIPSQYLPQKTGKQTKGVRSNGSFEGLSLSPSGDYFWVATEQPLLQDQPNWKQGDAGFSRLLRFKKKTKGGWEYESEWKYPMELATPPGQESQLVLGQGCSEVFALNDTDVLVLERGVYTTGTQINYNLKLHQVSIQGLIGGNLPVLAKQLIYDFSAIKDKFTDGRGLDNLEGISWGPQIKGQKTLIFISDDNFTPLQRSVWLAFKLK